MSANTLNGIDSKWISKEEIQKLVPIMNTDNLRYPVLGASFQPRAGTARHDTVAWGYAMRADEMGVDIIQNCEAYKILTENGKVIGLETSKGIISSPDGEKTEELSTYSNPFPSNPVRFTPIIKLWFSIDLALSKVFQSMILDLGQFAMLTRIKLFLDNCW